MDGMQAAEAFRARRGIRPMAAFADRPHGTRLRYMAGCKCFQCRRANSDYERERGAARARGEWNGIVSAERAREHLLALRRKRIGTRAISATTDVSRTQLNNILAGRQTQLRAQTERRILACTREAARGDRHLVPAGPTWRLIEKLLEEGYTKTRIANEMGLRCIQLCKTKITARSAHRFAVVYRRLTE